LDIIDQLPPGKALEFGCGPGGMLYELNKRGFVAQGVEISEKSRMISKALLSEFETAIVYETSESLPENHFDYIFSFEVLEHIKDDLAALKSWLRHLKHEGIIVISVPAHKRKWNITDVMVGHYRRYEKEEIELLLENAGIEILSIQTYGWPGTYFLEKIRLLAFWAKMKKEKIKVRSINIGDIELSQKSGVNRKIERTFFKLYSNKLLGEPLFWIFLKLQKIFYHTDLGISYIVVGRKTLQKGNIYEQ
jgi:SAM-dependent methyltransferase